MENAVSSCFIHSVAGIFSVLFFWLGTASGITALLVIHRFKEDDPFYQAVVVRLRFGIAYSAIGSLLLLLAIILGVFKAGVVNVKAGTSFLLFIYATSIPFISKLKRSELRKIALLLVFLGPLSTLNLLVGNFLFTSFHNFL